MCVVGQKEQHNNGTTKKQQHIHGKKRRWWKRERMNNICISVSVRNRKKRTDRQNLMAIVCAAVPPQNQYEFVISWLKDREPQRPGPKHSPFHPLTFFFPGWNSFAKTICCWWVPAHIRPIHEIFFCFSLASLPLFLVFFFWFCVYFSITELYIEMFLSLAQL